MLYRVYTTKSRNPVVVSAGNSWEAREFAEIQGCTTSVCVERVGSRDDDYLLPGSVITDDTSNRRFFRRLRDKFCRHKWVEERMTFNGPLDFPYNVTGRGKCVVRTCAKCFRREFREEPGKWKKVGYAPIPEYRVAELLQLKTIM